MILSKEMIKQRIAAGRALLSSGRNCGDEEIGLSLPSFCNLLDTLGDYLELQSQLAAAEERYKELRETVLISCHPPIDCNDAEVLKIYMLACFEVASKEEVKPCGT